MVNYFKPTKNKKSTGQSLRLKIDKLDHHGIGVAVDRKTRKPIFIPGSLVGELVEAKVVDQKNKFSRAKLTKVIEPSAQRLKPKCKHYWQCGGCDLQHLSIDEQLAFKREKVQSLFARQGFKEPLPWQDPLISEEYQYRRKARIGVQYNKLNQPIVGFRQLASNNLIPIKSCEVLAPEAMSVFTDIELILSKLSQKKSVGHVEVLVSEGPESENSDNKLLTLVVRQLIKLTKKDQKVWTEAAKNNKWNLVLDEGATLRSIYHPIKNCEEINSEGVTNVEVKDKLQSKDFKQQNNALELSYSLFDKTQIFFLPNNFIQVNAKINDLMVAQAIDWLKPTKEDKLLDLFCGLGNFSLPFAKLTKSVVGVEGIDDMVTRASENATRNHLTNCNFYQADLNAKWADNTWAKQLFDIVILDPARAGAYEAIAEVLAIKPAKILYVSCEPSSLALDAERLNSADYSLTKIAIMDMFSQTKHIETMVLFSRA